MGIIEIKGDNVRKGKIKYIFKKIFKIFLIGFIFIILYELFTQIKSIPENQETYGTRISADEEKENKFEDISAVIEKVSAAVVGVSKIKNIGSSAFLSDSSESLGLGSGIIVSNKGYILTNQHVAGDINNKCYITADNGQTYDGKII
jgi:S1-C subfamily serine protease